MTNSTSEPRGTIFYDGNCGLCTKRRTRMERLFGHRGFNLKPLQDEGVAEMLGLPPGEVPEEVKLRLDDGRVLGGADAVIELARHVWWMPPLRLARFIPGGMGITRAVYRRIARHRHSISRACALTSEDDSLFCHRISQITEITVLTGVSVGAMFLARNLPAWTFMWFVAFVVWFDFKWLTWLGAARRSRGNAQAAVRYFLAWPGMDARPFLNPARSLPEPPAIMWLRGAASAWAGVALIFGVAPLVAPENLFLAGWISMIGTALLLHFGAFQPLTFAWRRAGVEVEPIMREPTRAKDLADFWHRWNRGFRDLAYRLVFLPVNRRFGIAIATIAVFAFSGVVHDLVISVPAGAGYGLPTIYFLIQGAGVLLEKSPLGRRMHPAVRRTLMYVAVIAPLPLLFHRAFVMNVYVPFLSAIGAVQPEARLSMQFDLATLVRIGGLLHFAILIAGVLTPLVLKWRSELMQLHPLSRHIIWVHGSFVMMTIIGFGLVATIHAPLLAAGTSGLCGSVCGFIALFWGSRLVIQFALFNPGPLLSNAVLKLGYHGLTIVFIYFAATFGWAALHSV